MLTVGTSQRNTRLARRSRTLWRVTALVLLVAVAGCRRALPTSPGVVEPPPPPGGGGPPVGRQNQYGVGVEVLQEPQTVSQEAFRAAGGARIGWARMGFDRELVHLGAGRYQWNAMDRIVAEATGQGVQILGILGYSPRWDTTAPPQRDHSVYPPRNYDQWADYVFQTVSRYRNRVQHWEVWNEPDIEFWIGTPGEYARLLAVAYREVRRADPGAKVLLGGLTGEDVSVAFFQTIMADPSYPAGANFDIMNVHAYGAREDARAKVARFLSLTSRLLWVTEMGWASDPTQQTPDFCCGEEAQARYLTAVMPELLEAGADKVFWWTLWIPDNGGEGEAQQTYGLLDGRMRPKPAYFALRDLLAAVPN